ncbi:HupE / UreJ protein [Streptomyces sp. DvalAA-14]|uniref:HupE/UreJ family protein n=1 Tax=unclassified Streptomyces TaxID=2593676 RepID=UPI00081BADAB|nr:MULTISPECIES: HupE/UreJ family protein [unclassified Streptomyces]MYS18924.1 HupE/UreJ family protein [Streptomyces sp. SID4948]SCD32015.1 HupE / UreJ protein [Streptomyces sp. DvalAA-14]
MSARVRRSIVGIIAAVIAFLGVGQPASAHGFSSVVYVHVTAGGDGRLRTTLQLEYDLFVVSTADAEHDDALFRAGTAAFDAGDTRGQAAALDAHAAAAVRYITERFTVTSNGKACAPVRAGGFTMGRQQGVPYAQLPLDWACAGRDGDQVLRSALFPDAETYVTGTKTIVTYRVDGRSGSAALDADHPSFSLAQPWYQRFWEFFRLGAEHLLTGTDHILFLLALIAGSRRLREIVLVATSFTVAHSVTFVLAALGLVDVPSKVVEPVIALSIAVVAGWYLWRVWRRGGHATELRAPGRGHFSLDRAGWTRLGVVFCFGLVHGLGFAGALGVDAAWSWTLLWSLLVFNIGIEAVQLALIAALFPLLAVLRHRAPTAGLWATGAISAGVFVMGLVWFLQRVFGC